LTSNESRPLGHTGSGSDPESITSGPGSPEQRFILSPAEKGLPPDFIDSAGFIIGRIAGAAPFLIPDKMSGAQ
jgi:hypothetical protein